MGIHHSLPTPTDWRPPKLTDEERKRLRMTPEEWKELRTNGITVSEGDWDELQVLLKAATLEEEDDDE